MTLDGFFVVFLEEEEEDEREEESNNRAICASRGREEGVKGRP